MMRDVARQFVRDEVLPAANRLDPVKGDMPRELIEQMGELGFFGILIPEEYGGLGLGAFEYCLVAEELARGWMSVASIIARGNCFYRSIPGEGEERRRKIEADGQGPVPRRGGALGARHRLGPLRRHLPRAARRRRVGDHRQQSTGARSPTAPTTSACSAASTIRTRPAGARPAPSRSRWRSPRASCPRAAPAAPIPKIGYFGWKTWELHFDGVRAPARLRRRRGNPEAGRARAGRRLRPRPRPRPHRRPLDRPGAGRAGGRHRLRQGARAVRPADLRLPGHPLQDRHHGHRGRGRAAADVLRLQRDRRRPRRAGGDLDGQAVRLRDGRAGDQRGAADLRRRRLHHPATRSSATGATRG